MGIRRDIKKLLKATVAGMVSLSTSPTVSLPEELELALGKKVLETLLKRNYSAIASDPIMLKAIRKILMKRATGIINDLTDLLEIESLVTYTKAKCGVCGARLYRIKETPFCLQCCLQDRKDLFEGQN
jgi:hypothetical protein